MTAMLAKVCGLTRAIDVACALEAGADLIGFVHHPDSPRHCAALTELAPLAGDAGVLVMVADSAEAILAVLETTRLKRVQPYLQASVRAEAVQTLQAAGYQVLLPWPDIEGQPQVDAALYVWETPKTATGVHGGSGQTHAAAFPPPGPFLLAGGIDAHNLALRAQQLAPETAARLRGFDAASRLESAPGIKDQHRLNQFVNKAHAYAL